MYAQGVLTSQNDIKRLNELWRSPEIQNTFEHAKESLATNSDLSASVAIPSYGWVEREQKGKEISKKSSEELDPTWTALTEDDVSKIITEFRKTYPQIMLDINDKNGSISVGLTAGLR